MVFKFCSTSKVTFPGSGIAAISASKANLDFIKKQMSVQTIGHDKLNQLRHARFFGDFNGMLEHMKKHADIIRPKFEAVLEMLDKELGDLGIAKCPDYDECFGYSLLLAMGGSENLENIKIVKTIPYIDICTQTIGEFEVADKY